MERESLTLVVTLAPEQEQVIVRRVAKRLQEDRDNGFLNVRGAAAYLATTPKAVYTLVERQKLPHHHAGARLLFDRAELRAWVEGGG